ncbi:helix-turn-helix domain-containing protein [Chryseobacterium indoltheticum]|uniref:helix-turn-helix domain-containing protein n=1 Tax=Chryseobacterium indoltheticum TaxID=254 RepID=UPI00191358A1|nr:response regulator transcription factor [Chryseobacterium indoltheticum]QQQ28962.1 helix-turn-helix transcriptional regulator [Chryseobacterium indoltheticum]
MEIVRIRSITEYHRFRGLPNPEHPLISLVDYALVQFPEDEKAVNIVMDFYSIALKRDIGAKLHYGQQMYDFDEGLMSFIAPGQVLRIERDPDLQNNGSGYLLQIHPDFLWGSHLAKNIKKHSFFDYSIHEALFLSSKEETIILNIFENIRQEYHTNIDKFTQDLIIAQIELLLKYCDRYYNRQFITRKISSHQMLTKVENFLNSYFSDASRPEGLLSVKKVADAMNVSSDYLSSMLKQLTGKNVQEHIHQKMIEKAKEKLSTTTLSVSEIAYELGFEHPQSFSKLFKSKTNVSPMEFRRSFN